jgi:hypothetical protein
MSIPVSDIFQAASDRDKRHLTSTIKISWARAEDPNVQFFTIGTSEIGGDDPIKGSEEVRFMFDYFEYDDESELLDYYEYERNYDRPLLGISRAQATAILRNNNNRFVPGYDPTIGAYVTLKKRPIRIALGFKTPQKVTVPNFLGLTQEQKLNIKNNQLTVRANDAIDDIYTYTFDSVIMWEDKTVDQILVDIMDLMGITAENYDFDVGINTIPFVWVEPNQNAGNFIKELCESELAHFYLDEGGLIKFENQNNWAGKALSETITDNDIKNMEVNRVDEVINVAIVKSDVREMQAVQSIWSLESTVGAFMIPASGTLEVWANINDPSKSLVKPLIGNPVTTSYFRCNKNQDGSGDAVTTNVSITTWSPFATAAKMIFTNTNAFNVWVITAEIFGAPAKIVSSLNMRIANATSVAESGVQSKEFTNKFISNEDMATDFGRFIVDNYGNEAMRLLTVDVRGKPQRQLGDLIIINSDRFPGLIFTGNIVGIVGQIDRGIFTQKLTVLGLMEEEV